MIKYQKSNYTVVTLTKINSRNVLEYNYYNVYTALI